MSGGMHPHFNGKRESRSVLVTTKILSERISRRIKLKGAQ